MSHGQPLDYTDGIGYADDLTLLTSTRSGLKVLIEICEQYADDYCVKFNRVCILMFLEVAVVNPTTEQMFLLTLSCRVFRILFICIHFSNYGAPL